MKRDDVLAFLESTFRESYKLDQKLGTKMPRGWKAVARRELRSLCKKLTASIYIVRNSLGQLPDEIDDLPKEDRKECL